MAPSSSFGQSLFPLALSLLLTAVAAAAAGEEAREDRTAANATAAEGVGGMGALVMAALGSPMALVQHFAPAWLAGNPMLPMLAYSAMAFGTTMVTLGLRRLWRYLDRAFYTHVTLHGHTRSYEWFAFWLQQQPLVVSSETQVDIVETQDESQNTGRRNNVVSDQDAAELAFRPSVNCTQRVPFVDKRGRKHMLSIERARKDTTNNSYGSRPSFTETYRITLRNPRFAGSSEETAKDIIMELLEEARRKFTAERRLRTTIYFSAWEWELFGSRMKRPLHSVHLPEAVLTDLVGDMSWWLGASRWYQQKGIPYRRGYLLWGKPGCGKTSTIFALAGKYDLPVCFVNLQEDDMDDSQLVQLLNKAPNPCILLFEEIDTAFTVLSDTTKKSKKKETRGDRRRRRAASATSDGSGSDSEGEEEEDSNKTADSLKPTDDSVGTTVTGAENKPVYRKPVYKVSFNGLLNALDGIVAQEGRIVFMTTNHRERLDPALTRPGRIDREFQFVNAGLKQLVQLFLRFFEDDKYYEVRHDTKEAQRAALDKDANVFAEKFRGRTNYSLAEVQGYLMSFIRTKDAPLDAIENVEAYFRAKDERDANAANEAAARKKNEGDGAPEAADAQDPEAMDAALRPASPPARGALPAAAKDKEPDAGLLNALTPLPRGHTIVAAASPAAATASLGVARSHSQPAAVGSRRPKGGPRLQAEDMSYILHRVTSRQSEA